MYGVWFDPRPLLQEDGADGKAEALAGFAAFYLACKPFGPAKLGGALVLTPGVRRFVQQRPVLLALVEAVATVGAQVSTLLAPVREAVSPLTSGITAVVGSAYRGLRPRAALKAELLELADKSAGGTKPLSPAEQERFEEIRLRELPALCMVEAPTRSALFSGTWECRWTDEKELNFAVRNGLFGLPWVRTYQAIDIAAGSLENVLEFEGGELRVGSCIAPDDADGTRFNFAFSNCALTWRDVRVPLPPVGRGWGELLYLDEDLRIQRDVRGDMLVATKVVIEYRTPDIADLLSTRFSVQ